MKSMLHIYTRVSTSSQEDEGTSLDTQLELGIERAQKLGMSYKVWNEGGRSSSKDDLSNRPVLTELLQSVDDGDVKDLYVWNTDRLSRNLNTWGMIRFKLIKNDVTLHTPTGKQILSDPQTNLMLGILSEISQYDNQLRAERFRLGKLKRVKQGAWMSGQAPYGYQVKDSQLVVDEEEQKWVKFIYETYSQGDSVDEIRTKLLHHGVITKRGNPVWSHGSINKILQNTHYEGYYTYTDNKSGETLRSVCPILLNPALVKSVRDLREKRGYKKAGSRRVKTSNQKHTYLLTGLLVCGHCNSFYGGNYKKTQTSYYSCNQKTNKFKTKFTHKYVECGSNRNIRIDKTDEVVWESVVNVISKSHTFKESVKTELLGKNSHKKSLAEVKSLEKKQNKLKKEIDDVTDSIINFESTVLIGKRDKKEVEKIVKNLEKHRLSLESEVEKISQALLDDEQQRKWIDWVKEFASRVEQFKNPDFPIEDRKRFLEGVLNRVVVTNKNLKEHELKIEFRLPYVGDNYVYKNSEDKSQGYVIKRGKKSKKVVLDLLKKSIA